MTEAGPQLGLSRRCLHTGPSVSASFLLNDGLKDGITGGGGVLCAPVFPDHWFWDPHCSGPPSSPALPCCRSSRAPHGSQPGPACGLNPSAPPSLRSWSLRGRCWRWAKVLACPEQVEDWQSLHGGWAEYKQRARTALANTPSDSRRVLGTCRGVGVPPAPWVPLPCAGMRGAHSVLQSRRLHLGRARTTPSSRRPLPAPHGVSPGLASTPPQRDQLGKELVPPRGRHRGDRLLGSVPHYRAARTPGPRAEPQCGRKAGIPVPALAPMSGASAHTGLSFPVRSLVRRHDGPAASQPACRHPGGDGLSWAFLPSQSAPVRPGAWRGWPGPPRPPGTLPGALDARLLASAGSGEDGPSPRQRPARASGAARGALGAVCEPGRGGPEHGAGESRASCLPPAVAPGLGVFSPSGQFI